MPAKKRTAEKYPYIDPEARDTSSLTTKERPKEWVQKAAAEDSAAANKFADEVKLKHEEQEGNKAYSDMSAAEKRNYDALKDLEKANKAPADAAEDGYIAAAKGFGVDFASTLMSTLSQQKVKPFCNVGEWSKWSGCEKACIDNQDDQSGAMYQRRTRSRLTDVSPAGNPAHGRLDTPPELGESEKARRSEIVAEAKHEAQTKQKLAKEELAREVKLLKAAKKKIAELEDKKDNTPDLQQQVEIDYHIEEMKRKVKRATERSGKARREAERAERIITRAKDEADKDRSATEKLVATINSPPYCEEPELEGVQKCSESAFCAMDCKVSEWSGWPTCVAGACGFGVKNIIATHTRTRRVIRPGIHGGKICPVLRETRQCLDESCVWRIPEASAKSLTQCKPLLASRQFQQWSQVWVQKRDESVVRAKYNMALKEHQRDIEKKAVIDSAVIHIRRKVESLCMTAHDLHHDIRVPTTSLHFATHCRARLNSMCRNTAFREMGAKCDILMDEGCRGLSEKMSQKFARFHMMQARGVNAEAKAVGKAWAAKCVGLVKFTASLLERFLGAVQSNALIGENRQELDEYARQLQKLSKGLEAYETTVFDIGKGEEKSTWACSRAVLGDVREQNFRCVMQTKPPMKLVVCKGDQVPRLLASTLNFQCPYGSEGRTVKQAKGEDMFEHESRRQFGDFAFGCKCPKFHTPQYGHCCRKGEVVFSNTVWSSKLNTSVVAAPRCQCPPGSEFVNRPVGHPRWAVQCDQTETDVGWDACIDSTGQTRDMERGRTKCCQLREGECTPQCPPGMWRMADGFCQSAMVQGCYDFDADALAAGDDVRCLVPSSEVVISENECKGDGVHWIESKEFGGSYCKRPVRLWETLNKECVHKIDPTKLNEDRCRTFHRHSFMHPEVRTIGNPNLGEKMEISYFAFISETYVTGEGSPAGEDGSRLTGKGMGMNEDLPWSYQTQDQSPYSAADYNSVRRMPRSEPREGRRKLLFMAPMAAVELRESSGSVPMTTGKTAGPRVNNAGLSLEDRALLADHDKDGIFPGSNSNGQDEHLQPMSEAAADLEQNGYHKKEKKPKKIPRRPADPTGGFYSIQGYFKMSQDPKDSADDDDELPQDGSSEEGPTLADETLVQVGEGAAYNPILSGMEDPVRVAKEQEAMEEIQIASKAWKAAKDVQLPPMRDAKPGEGSIKKACVAPPRQAECFAFQHSGLALHNNPDHRFNPDTDNATPCLSPQDNSWFRVHCEQY